MGRHPHRPPRASRDGRSPCRRCDAGEARACHRAPARAQRSAGTRCAPQPEPPRRGGARRAGGGPPPRGNARTARPRRCRLCVDQGVFHRVAAVHVVVRRDRRAGDRPAHAPVRARRIVAEAEVHQPRHGGVPRPRPHDRGLHGHPEPAAAGAPRGRDRAPGLPARCAGCAPGAHRMGDEPPCRRWGAHQDPGRQGSEPGDGARRCDHPRLAARDLRDEAGDRHQLQAGARLGPHRRAHPRGEDRCRRPQPVRRRLRLASRSAARRRRPNRLRDAARHGDGAGRSREAHRRLAPPLHACREPGRVRRGHLLSHPPARRECEPGELHVGSVRARLERCALRARAAAVPRLGRRTRRRPEPARLRSAAQPKAGPHP